MAKVVSRMVWCSRAWRKSFPEWFGISVLGENHFPKGLEFPRMAKVISRMVWSSRAWRKSFPKWFGVSALGENYFPNGLELVVAKIWKYSSKVVMPARVRKPKDKALVEDAVKLTYARIYPKLKEEDRDSLETLNQTIRSALKKHNNMILTGRSYARWEQFEDIEQSQLKPLPIVPFELHNRKMLTVQRNGHVRLLGHYYSVPHTYVGKKVTVFYTSQHVEIYQYYT